MRIHARPLSWAFIVLVLAFQAGFSGPLAPSAAATPDFAFERLAGHDRFDTARVVSTELGGSETVILARGDVFADALAGTYLAGVNGAPVLLTRSDGLPAETDAAINAVGARRVLLLGGTTAISPAVEAHLRGKGLAVERIGGVDRYETAAMAARHGGPAVLGTSDGLRTAIVVSGANFPDALSGGPVSYAQKFPTLLTAPGAASPAMLAAIDALEIRQVIIIGGPTAVAAPVESTLRSRGLNVNRLFGQDRSGTSVAVARIAVERFGHSPSHMNVARGDDFADALAFSAHAGRDPKAGGAAPLYLTISKTVAGQELVEAVRAQSGSLQHGHIAGGLSALSQEVEDELVRAARGGVAELELDYSTIVPGGTMRGEVRGDNVGAISVSGCGLRGLHVREGAGAFEFQIPAEIQPGTCSLVFTTNFTDGGPTETDRRTITVEQRDQTGNPPATPTTQPGSGTTTTQPGTGDPTTTTQPGTGGTTPTTQPGSGTTTPPGSGGGTTTTQPGDDGGAPGGGGGTTTTTQPPPTTTTTTEPPPTTTTTTQPSAPAGSPTVESLTVQDEGASGASAGDVVQVILSEPLSGSADDSGSSIEISGATKVECGSAGISCALMPGGTYNGVSYPADQVVRIVLGDSPSFGYPAQLTSLSGHWVDLDGNAVSLAPPSQTTLAVGPITGRPSMFRATASASSETVTVTYPEAIDCNGAGHAQFAYLESGNSVPRGATTITCDGSSSIVLTFPDGTIDPGDSGVSIRYRESSVLADRVTDSNGQAATTTDFQAVTVEP